MKNFQEKEVKNLSLISGGEDPKVTNVRFKINFTIHTDGFFDGSIKNGIINELDKQADKPVVTTK